MSASISGIAALAFDCADPRALATFWQNLLGGRVIVDESGDAELRLRDGSDVSISSGFPKRRRARTASTSTCRAATTRPRSLRR
ncbi:VOC family protein [Mycetocola sp. 2940]|uniref:VOC family protein n=1 Tax=Mycetocola sp. 2940 TaxID=3156452 RepID=UPI003392CB04